MVCGPVISEVRGHWHRQGKALVFCFGFNLGAEEGSTGVDAADTDGPEVGEVVRCSALTMNASGWDLAPQDPCITAYFPP